MAPSPSAKNLSAFVTGVTGQDGFYLARLLLERGFEVTAGLLRSEWDQRDALGADLAGIRWIEFELTEPDSIRSAIEQTRPDQVFHLAGVSHVPQSWQIPAKTFHINAVGTIHLAEAMLEFAPAAHLVFAGSGDCFDHAAAPATGLSLDTPTLCANPYSLSKFAAARALAQLREQRSLNVSIAYSLNHTSPRRPIAFIERRIVRDAVLVSTSKMEKLVLGSIESCRDWSWAEDIAEALAAMAQQDAGADVILGSGQLHTTGDWVRRCFDRLGLDLEEKLHIDRSLLHQADRAHTFADISGAKQKLGWEPKLSFEQIVDRLLEIETGAQS